MSTVRAVIAGVTGRMGQALVRVASEFAQLTLTGAIASPHSPSLGRDAGELAGVASLGVAVTADLAACAAGADVIVDFSQPQATSAHLAACRAAGKALLIGTTGLLGEPSEADLEAAAGEIALLVAPNTSIGVSLLTELVRSAACSLPAGFDIEILETHHRLKRDAPSGTALSLARAAAEGRGLPPGEAIAAPGASRAGPRRQGEVGFAVMRGGDVVGEHEVRFLGLGEQVTLGHKVTDRAVFARGALSAALWLSKQPPGRYTMRDFLFTNQ